MPQDQILSASQRETRRELPIYSLHLDLIRGFAALLVLVSHLHLIVTGHTGAGDGQPGGLNLHPANATGLGHAAVVIFFVLSGYLVGGSVLRDLRRNAFSWSKYSLRRVARLWTVLVPTLAIGAVIDATTMHFYAASRVVSTLQFTHNFQAPGPLQFLRYLGFLQSIRRLQIPQFGTNAALWSLSNEFWYYVLFPLLAVSLIGSGFSKHLRAVLFLLALFLLWFLGVGITGYFPLWLCGVAAYIAPALIPAKFQGPATIVMTLQFCLVLFLMRSNAVGGLKADSVIALSFTLLLYTLLHQTGPASSSIYSRFAHAVSFPSYSLYACHIPVCILLAAFCEQTLPNVFRHGSLAGGIIFALVLLYAGVFYMLFERNTDRFRSFAESIFKRSRSSPASSRGNA
jgi:peptidoglycan/LPS O-acetylase OafA/YrhL